MIPASRLLLRSHLNKIKLCNYTKRFSTKSKNETNFFQKHPIVSTAVGISTACLLYYFISKKPNIPIEPNRLQLRDRFNFINEVVKKCAPAVVYIEIKDLRRIDPETGRALTASNGSGFLIRNDGWILTNAHVVINKPEAAVMVIMRDGTTYEATVEDADMNIDLALLKINTDSKLPYLQLGNSSDINTGEWVVALGSPLSLSHSATAGIVSSVDRAAQELGLRNFSMRYIQTDAAITFGNSGGPLVNLNGDVIGINNLRITAGISFAIPIDYAKRFLENSKYSSPDYYISNDKNAKRYLGVTTITITPETITNLIEQRTMIPDGLTHGVLVWKVINGTPANVSGLEVGDIITHVNNTPVKEPFDIYMLLPEKNDTAFKLAIIRKGKKKEIMMRSSKRN